MHEHRRLQLRRASQHADHRGVVQVATVDVRSDLYARHAQVGDTPFQLLDRQLGILHRDGAEAHEVGWKGIDHTRDVIVENPAEVECVLWLGPVAELDRHGR